MHACDDKTIIGNVKYKTIGDLKQTNIKSIIQIVTRMNPCDEKDYMEKWMFDTHYIKKNMSGNLTSRVSQISNGICYREIIKRYFNNHDMLGTKTTMKNVLSDECMSIITKLHTISPSMCGVFFDYLIRRLICEITKQKFKDTKAFVLCGSILDSMDHICDFVSDCTFTMGFDNELTIPLCRRYCYKATTDTFKYKTIDILRELFITSLSHSEAFGGFPKQKCFDDFYNQLYFENESNILISQLTNLCHKLTKCEHMSNANDDVLPFHETNDILLNPGLGGELQSINARIPSDADLVIDDQLLDIKCTSTEYVYRDFFQLLGYTCLLRLQKKIHRKINTMSILNLLKGELHTYCVKTLDKSNCLNFIKLLTNEI